MYDQKDQVLVMCTCLMTTYINIHQCHVLHKISNSILLILIYYTANYSQQSNLVYHLFCHKHLIYAFDWNFWLFHKYKHVQLDNYSVTMLLNNISVA